MKQHAPEAAPSFLQKKTTIVIPTFNGLELLRTCIDSIRKYTVTPYDVIVVDNGSTDGTTAYCIEQKLTFVSFAHNRGFPAACNAGLRIASGEALLLLNNDVIVTPNWLTNMLACLYSSDSIGMAGPTSNYVSGRQQVDLPFVGVEQFQQIAAGSNATDPDKWQEIERLVGFCLLFKRELADAIGLFDERFSPGHYEDDDYCYRARLRGFRLMMCKDVLVYHKGSASFRNNEHTELAQLIERNHRLFIDKWGFDPRIYI